MTDHTPVLRTQESILATPHPTVARHSVPALLRSTADRQYRCMVRAFHSTGGIASSDQVTEMLSRRTDQPISILARWIVDHSVLGFSWESRTMLPLFQFDLRAMTVRPAVTKVIRELVPLMSDWDVSLWFAQPNAWLAGKAPVDAIEADFHRVYAAARCSTP